MRLVCKTKSRSHRPQAGDVGVPHRAHVVWGKGVQPAAQHIVPGPSRVDVLPGGSRESLNAPAYRSPPTGWQIRGGHGPGAPGSARAS